MTQAQTLLENIIKIIREHWKVDAIYLYGSRAKGTALPESDWDIAILFTDYIKDRLEQVSRPQTVEATLERTLNCYGKISVVDLEIVPAPLQYQIINGQVLFDRNVPHVKRIENSIISKIEKDYD